MAIGIDFGTTKSAIVCTDSTKPIAISDGQGHRSIPSMVMVVPDERLYVGWEALNHPARYDSQTEHYTISSIKRLIGKSGKTKIGNFETSPQEVAALILGALKAHAEIHLDMEISDVVIAVPAHFDINQRWATLQAAELAGLKVSRLLNEASAAVLAFSRSHNKREGVTLVFDFGGGTLDVSVVSFGENVYEVVATAGDDQLGGDDFDQVVFDWVLRRMKARLKSFPELSQLQQLVLREAATRAKVELSSASSTRIYIPGFLQTRRKFWDVDLTLRRELFEELSSGLSRRARAVLGRLLKDCGTQPQPREAPTEVLLTGGASRMPEIRRIVQAMTGIEPYAGLDSEVGVAEGASLMSAALERTNELLLLDVATNSYSVGLLGGVLMRLIERNRRIPAEARHAFTICGSGEDLTIRIYQGEEKLASKNLLIGELDFTGLPLNTEIEVVFKTDANNTLAVSANHEMTGRNITAQMQAPHRLTREQMKSVQPWVDQVLRSYRGRLPS